jgi:hypothetical protein
MPLIARRQPDVDENTTMGSLAGRSAPPGTSLDPEPAGAKKTDLSLDGLSYAQDKVRCLT